ncbi:MAG: hypothetical protein JRN15_12475 [Nitrososphaerota archaeon]|nr:hypothetical protein [Nitrososphaerota archaeon]
MSSKSKFKEMTQRDSGMAQMITWLDGYAALHIVDPLRIERLLKSHSGTDLDQIWKGVKKDVTSISDLPSGSEKVKKFSRMASYARLASMVMTGVSFVFLIAFYLFQSDLRMLGNPIVAPAIIIAAMYIAIMVSLFASRRMNSAVRSYYQEHAPELSKSRVRLREAAQALIDRLQRDVSSHDLDPARYRFQVFHTDYKNIRVLKGKGPRYSAVVRTRPLPKE